jgi:hypothetical protein
MEKGTCGLCNSKFVLTKDNFLRKHGHTNQWSGGKRISSFCKGSGWLPTEFCNATLLIIRNRNRRRYLNHREKYGDNNVETIIYFEHMIRNCISIKNWELLKECA